MSPAPEIYVDADACPVKDEVLRVGSRHKLKIHFVANSWMRLPKSQLIAMVVVNDSFDAADNWITEHVTPCDIVITADILLADRCLKVGASVLGPNGKPFDDNNIGSAIAMRELNSQLRDMGEIKGHNAPFTPRDRSAFLQSLEQIIQKILRGV